MISNQRWRSGRDSYRPPAEPIKTRDYEVAVIEEAAAKVFVIEHHYSGSFPSARLSVGLFRRNELVGVAVFSHPMNQQTVPKWAGAGASGCELGRFVLLDDVPGNGETWFLSRARKLLAKHKGELDFIVSFSDPLERRTEAGELVKPGHIGTIYQASNARYCGRGNRNTIYVTPEGCIIPHRTLSKVRGHESGHAYAYEKMRELGAPRRGDTESGAAYITRLLGSEAVRTIRHPGNHVYLFGVHKTLTSDPTSYPKKEAA